jgi:hypothetical protein
MEVAPVVAPLRARITTVYDVPFVNPVIEIGELTEIGERVVQEVPLFVLNW